ncbi:MAG: DUF4406 domain-containing protein [Prevotellaceae bacterium]|nr:DUF4406 domain-containing protein [Prevotellaceae bacterium]
MKVYIAGPMTGYENYNREAFFEAAIKLKLRGAEPVHTASLPDGLGYEVYLEKSLEALDGCDAICFLRGWEESKGALMEYGYAKSRGLPEIKL